LIESRVSDKERQWSEQSALHLRLSHIIVIAVWRENQIRRASFTALASGEAVASGEAWESLWARE
jgi:hypothetical protein